MKKILLYSTMLIAVAIGCTDLTEELYSEIAQEDYPETSAQANVVHLSSYDALAGLFDDEGWWFLSQEISSDEMVAPTRAADWYDGGKWTQLQYHSWNASSDAVTGMWDKLWEGIGKSNDVLDKLVGTNEDALRVRAEVEAIRSLYYFWLIDNYGDVPYLTTKAGAPEQPYRLKRASIFDSLTTTLEANYPLLNSMEKVAYRDFASKEMALTLLVKLYLNAPIYTGNDDNAYYEKAITYSNELLSMGHLGLEANVMDLFQLATSVGGSELIFTVPFNEDTKEGFRYHMRSLCYKNRLTYNMTDEPWNGFCLIPDFFNKYEDTDVRKDGYIQYGTQFDYLGDTITARVKIDGEWVYVPVELDPNIKIAYMNNENMGIEGISNYEMTYNGARVHKYEVYEGAKTNLTVNFPVFRLADVIFMKAEAELRLSGSVSAESMTLVTQIWDRSNQTHPAGGLTLDNILDERGKELFSEGHRRTDMIRFGTFDQTFWGMNDGQTGSDDPNTVQNIFPISQRAIDSNPNLSAPAQ